MAETVSKSWFVVFNNPSAHGYVGEPHEICERLKNEWCCTEDRSGAWAYCIKHYEGHYPVYDDDGKFLRYAHAETDDEKKLIPADLHHIHMVLEDKVAMRFTAVKKTYAIGSHFEATKGSKKEASDYISKSGDYDEKPNKDAGLPWEEIIYCCQKGEIKGMQGRRSDLENIEQMLKDGMSPVSIMRQGLNYRRHESLIKKAYYDKRDEDTPEVREVKVIWHTGDSGSGKSYSRMQLMAQVGKENIYYLSDYKNGCFDGYNGQPYLWMEDYKNDFPFGDMLRYLDVYKADLHCRYSNAKALWTEVHITSVYHPIAIYNFSVHHERRAFEPLKQWARRISFIRYHYSVRGEFKYIDCPFDMTLEEMRKAAIMQEMQNAKEYTIIESDDEING